MRLAAFFVIAYAVLMVGFGVAPCHRATAQETFSGNGDTTNPPGGETFNGNDSAPTGTQGQVGNSFCPPPVIIINGAPTTPLNWSCGETGTQTQQWAPAPKNACDESHGDYNPVACDQQRCEHNPDLDVCTQFQTPVQPGLKNIERSPPPGETSPQEPPDVPAMGLVMSRCLHAKLQYIPVQALQPEYQASARKRFEITAPIATPFAGLPAGSQIALTEYAMALQVQALHDGLYGQPTRWDTDNQPLEFLVGWLDSCLGHAGLLPPGDPRIRFGKFLGVPVRRGEVITDARINGFSVGYQWDVVPPLSLAPPGWPKTSNSTFRQ